ncbi:MAG: glycosyltransferase [Candidatus Coatesbacteria bacterium]|nr:glycosyltransferase [Candidatus Coatesbacteria bacterium]
MELDNCIVSYGGLKENPSLHVNITAVEPLKHFFKRLEVLDYGTMYMAKKPANDNYIELMKQFKDYYLLEYIYENLLYPSSLLQAHKNMKFSMIFLSDDDWQFHIYSRFLGHYYNLCLTTYEWRLKDFKRAGLNAYHMQWAGNQNVYRKMDLEKEFDVTFIGSIYGQRYEIIKYLINNGVKLRIFGIKPRQQDLLDYWGGYVSTEESIEIINKSKINLSFLSASVKEYTSIKLRLFEIPVSGGFQICDDYEYVYKYFKKDKEIITFTDKKDLLNKIKLYLQNSRKRDLISERAYKRAISEHTWEKRYKGLFDYINVNNELHRKVIKPPISFSKILVFYNLNMQNRPNYITLKAIESQILKPYQIYYYNQGNAVNCPANWKEIFDKEEMKDIIEGNEYDYLTFIKDETHMEPEKICFQAYALDLDREENIEINFASWGLYRKNHGEIASYLLREQRDYRNEENLVWKSVFPDCVMVSKNKASKESELITEWLLKGDDNWVKYIFSDKKNYRYIDILVSLVWIPDRWAFELFDSYGKDYANYLIKSGILLLNKSFYRRLLLKDADFRSYSKEIVRAIKRRII